MDTDISSSELAGLVLGYLKASNNRVTARLMLEESPHLLEVKRDLGRKKAVSTKVDNMTLMDILQDYFQVREIVRDYLKRFFADAYPGGLRDSLSSQFMFLLERINESVECEPEVEDKPSVKMESVKRLFSTRTTRQKRALFDMKMAARDEEALRPPSAKRPCTSEANTQTSRAPSPEIVKENTPDEQTCPTTSNLGASKRKKNLLSKKSGGKVESSQSKSSFSKEESPENMKEVFEYLTSDKAAPIHQRIADKITEAYFLQPEAMQSPPGKTSEVPKEKSVATEIEELVRKFQNHNDPVTDMVLHSVMGESFSL